MVMDKEGFLYEISFDENETLKFTQLFTNTNIDVYDFLYADINHTRYVFIRNSVSNYKTTIQSGLNIITYS